MTEPSREIERVVKHGEYTFILYKDKGADVHWEEGLFPGPGGIERKMDGIKTRGITLPPLKSPTPEATARKKITSSVNGQNPG